MLDQWLYSQSYWESLTSGNERGGTHWLCPHPTRFFFFGCASLDEGLHKSEKPFPPLKVATAVSLPELFEFSERGNAGS